MPDWTMWLIGAGILVIAELFTGTFYLLMIAIGLGLGALAALLGADGPTQTLVAAVVGVAATMVLRRSRYGRPPERQAANDPNVNLDIGQQLRVPQWHERRAGDVSRRAVGCRTAAGSVGPARGLPHRGSAGQPPDRRRCIESTEQSLLIYKGCSWNSPSVPSRW